MHDQKEALHIVIVGPHHILNQPFADMRELLVVAAIRTHAEAPYKSKGKGVTNVLLLIEFTRLITKGFAADDFKDIAQTHHQLKVGCFNCLRTFTAANELQSSFHASLEVERVEVGLEFG